jgi:hypothetical protein
MPSDRLPQSTPSATGRAREMKLNGERRGQGGDQRSTASRSPCHTHQARHIRTGLQGLQCGHGLAAAANKAQARESGSEQVDGTRNYSDCGSPVIKVAVSANARRKRRPCSPPSLYAQAFSQVAAVEVLAEVRQLALQIDENFAADVAPAATKRIILGKIAPPAGRTTTDRGARSRAK